MSRLPPIKPPVAVPVLSGGLPPTPQDENGTMTPIVQANLNTPEERKRKAQRRHARRPARTSSQIQAHTRTDNSRYSRSKASAKRTRAVSPSAVELNRQRSRQRPMPTLKAMEGARRRL